MEKSWPLIFSFWSMRWFLMRSVNRITLVVQESAHLSLGYMHVTSKAYSITQQNVPFKTFGEKDFTTSVSEKHYVCLALKHDPITLIHVSYTSSKIDLSIRPWDFEIRPERTRWCVSEPAQRWGSSFSWYCCGFPHSFQYCSGLNSFKQSTDWLVSTNIDHTV